MVKKEAALPKEIPARMRPFPRDRTAPGDAGDLSL